MKKDILPPEDAVIHEREKLSKILKFLRDNVSEMINADLEFLLILIS